MKIVFISNYYNHHQKAFCDYMYKICNNSFWFISTSKMRDERVELGYKNEIAPYIIYAYTSKQIKSYVSKLICDADIVIAGSCPESYLFKRKIKNKVIFRYTERIQKTKLSLLKEMILHIKLRVKHYGNEYLLCAGSFVKRDFEKYGLFKDKALKWGYFPEFEMLNVHDIIKYKERNTILWCGRLLNWKRPQFAIEVVKRLISEGYNIHLNIIGSGKQLNELKQLIDKYDLSNNINIMGSMSEKEVRYYMKQSAIFLMTSTSQEGWGAVMNEAMNSACAIIASSTAGATQYLVNDGVNGLIFDSNDIDDLYVKLKYLLDNPIKQNEFGCMAYRTISNLWNAEVASNRLYGIFLSILSKSDWKIYLKGPCSKA